MTAETVTWRSDATFNLDVSDFEAACHRGATGDSAAAKIAGYQGALTRYDGDLLRIRERYKAALRERGA